ncbi:MAG: hypothetical protein HY22_00625, partial [[Candidatus Thermochlorobacteriaceae] bacterium GBChlB]
MKKSLLVALLFAASSFPLVVQHASAFSVLANYTLNGTLADAQAPSNPARNMAVIGSSTYTLGGIQLAGTSYLESPSIASFTTGNFTITANFRITSYPADYMPVFTAFDSQIAALITNTGAIQLRVGTSTTTGSLIVPLSQFNNVTITRDGTETRLYLNGILAVTITASVTSPTNRILTRSEISSVFRYFNGVMKNLQVYNRHNVVNTLTDSPTTDGALRWAFATVPDGGTITFTPSLSGTLSLDSGITVTKSLTVAGLGASNLTLSGKTASRILNVLGSSALTLSGLKFTEGNAAGGGAISSLGPLIINNCDFSNNRSTFSGAIDAANSLTLNGCNFTGNQGSSGGGGAITLGGTATSAISNCTFSNNSTNGPGGAIYVSETGTYFISNCTFTGNTASGSGGNGGALAAIETGITTITNCTFTNNTAQGGSGGGAIYDSGADPTIRIINCTITGNTASASGGGVCGEPSDGPIDRLLNTIVAGNSATSDPDISGDITTTGSTHNLIGNGTGMTGITNSVNGNQVGTSLAPINARLSALGSYGGSTQTVALLPGSPAINAGTASGAPTADQRGISRVGATDIGAFESRGFSITLTGGSPQTTLVSTAFPVALQASVASPFSEPVNSGVITFTPPGSGASCTFSVNPVTITSGNVSTTATANSIFGSYAVTASASGITTPASYSLVNLAAQPTGSSGIPNLSTLPTHPPNITVNFAPASPTPSGYLVVRRPSTTPRTDPADGMTYTISQVFSGQTVVSVGTATSFTDNTVTFGESYFYDVYPFNGSGAAINYFQSGVQTNAVALTALPVELS